MASTDRLVNAVLSYNLSFDSDALNTIATYQEFSGWGSDSCLELPFEDSDGDGMDDHTGEQTAGYDCSGVSGVAGDVNFIEVVVGSEYEHWDEAGGAVEWGYDYVERDADYADFAAFMAAGSITASPYALEVALHLPGVSFADLTSDGFPEGSLTELIEAGTLRLVGDEVSADSLWRVLKNHPEDDLGSLIAQGVVVVGGLTGEPPATQVEVETLDDDGSTVVTTTAASAQLLDDLIAQDDQAGFKALFGEMPQVCLGGGGASYKGPDDQSDPVCTEPVSDPTLVGSFYVASDSLTDLGKPQATMLGCATSLRMVPRLRLRRMPRIL